MACMLRPLGFTLGQIVESRTPALVDACPQFACDFVLVETGVVFRELIEEIIARSVNCIVVCLADGIINETG